MWGSWMDLPLGLLQVCVQLAVLPSIHLSGHFIRIPNRQVCPCPLWPPSLIHSWLFVSTTSHILCPPWFCLPDASPGASHSPRSSTGQETRRHRSRLPFSVCPEPSHSPCQVLHLPTVPGLVALRWAPASVTVVASRYMLRSRTDNY